ncbi:FtsH protease activity modulator HflK [Sphingomonas sp. CD22]|jgi:membrane protease subunit HflK|uniref:FtsH protease activity modulator HflK n=1 Tax=Sphingomonas sp. CD22 TaxID=3100214 RepID=UPI002ADF3669|nr:FtsH protease activity modulator HflK [Sphingomonas sp. CD22]MEA1084336.1 FtsH protease activity modulator HflK [Sphingomonas sp. CD22]
MNILPGRKSRPPILAAETPKGPWGQGDDANGGANGGGPRNPWSLPPGARKTGAKPTALDEFLRKARGGGGGGNGGGLGGLPGAPNARALWLIGAGIILLVWILYTSIHPIAPQERGVVTYLGRYSGTLDPGIAMTMPAPIARVVKVDVQNIRIENFPESGTENLMLTRDQNIIDLAYAVRWKISSPQNFVFQIDRPRDTVRATAESAMREVVANVSLDSALGPGRALIENQVQERMQKVLDDYKSGIVVVGVGIKQADPPARVNDAFKDVTAAQQDAQGVRNQAQSYAKQVVARAEGEASQFDKVYEQYRLAPEVTRRRMYYETMEAVLAKSDKTIVEANGVVPYLPLDRARRLPDAAPAQATQVQPAPTTGGGQ